MANAFPPEPERDYYERISTLRAWLDGDPDELYRAYGSYGGTGLESTFTQRGGVFGAVRRFFMGEPPTSSGAHARVHVPLPDDIATTSANVLMGEPPSIKYLGSSESPPEVEELFDRGLGSKLHEASRLAAALGCAYLRTVWDDEVDEGKPWADVVAPDYVIPTFKYGRLVSGIVWRVVETKSGRVLRHLEEHLPGEIQHTLWRGDVSHLGEQVPLSEAGDFEDFPDGGVIKTGTQRLTLVHLPNKITEDERGASDFDGLEALFDQLDEVQSSWGRDVRLSKARLFVDETLWDSPGAGKGITFDGDAELYEKVQMGTDEARRPIEMVQFAIRGEEHERIKGDLKRQIVESAGYSPQTFGIETKGQGVTATEVTAKKQGTASTRKTKIGYALPAVKRIVEVLLDLTPDAPTGAEVSVVFGEYAPGNPTELAQVATSAVQAGIMSKKTAVQVLNPGWDELRIDEELALLAIEAKEAQMRASAAREEDSPGASDSDEPGALEENNDE